MDTVFLHGLKAQTLIGVFDWERRQPQTVLQFLATYLAGCAAFFLATVALSRPFRQNYLRLGQ